MYRLSILVHKLQHLRAVRSSEVIKLTVTVIHTQIIGAEVCTVIYKKNSYEFTVTLKRHESKNQ